MKKLMLGILFGVVLLFNHSPALAALSASDTTWTKDDVTEVNNATPGTSKTFLGTRLQGVTASGTTTLAADASANPAGGTCDGDYTTPTTTFFKVTSSASKGESYCLGNAIIPDTPGTPAYNKRITISLVTDNGNNFNVTPATKTGFNFVTLDDAKDSVTLRYINATEGWVVDGNNGATIN